MDILSLYRPPNLRKSKWTLGISTLESIIQFFIFQEPNYSFSNYTPGFYEDTIIIQKSMNY